MLLKTHVGVDPMLLQPAFEQRVVVYGKEAELTRTLLNDIR